MAPKQTDPQFKLRLSEDLKALVEEGAISNNRSMNAEIIARLEQAYGQAAERAAGNAAHFSRLHEELERIQLLTHRRIPEGLYTRIQQLAQSRERSVEEEVVQALEKAFPAPQPFSLDWFNDEWIARILAAHPTDRPALVEAANEVLMQNGGNYEVWLGDGDGDDEGSVVLGRRLVREEKRVAASGDLEGDVLSLIAVMEEEVHNKNYDTPPPSLRTELGNRLGGIISSRTELAAVTVVERLQDAGLLKKSKAGEASDVTEAAPRLRRLA